MAKATLPTNYQDDILNVSTEGKRKYRMVYNDDGTVSFDDVTPYDQEGSDFGAGDINATNEAVNQSLDKAKVIDDLETIQAVTNEGFVMGALAGKALNESLQTLNSETELWTQNNATFDAQTINLDLSSYKRVGIYWNPWQSSIPTMYTEFPIALSSQGNNSVLYFQAENKHYRYLSVTINGISFTDGYVHDSVNNSSAIPSKIIGIK